MCGIRRLVSDLENSRLLLSHDLLYDAGAESKVFARNIVSLVVTSDLKRQFAFLIDQQNQTALRRCQLDRRINNKPQHVIRRQRKLEGLIDFDIARQILQLFLRGGGQAGLGRGHLGPGGCG